MYNTFFTYIIILSIRITFLYRILILIAYLPRYLERVYYIVSVCIPYVCI